MKQSRKFTQCDTCSYITPTETKSFLNKFTITLIKVIFKSLAYILSEWLRNLGKGNFRNLKSKKFPLGGMPRKIKKSVSIFPRSAPVFI